MTTKANGSDIDVFGVGRFGLLSAAPVVNSEPGAVPFAVSFDAAGHLVIAEAGTNALATFSLNPGGTVTPISTVGTGQAATCWVAPAQGFFYASNAGSGSVSQYSDSGGSLALAGQTATDPGSVDAAASIGGQYLYVQTGGNGIVDEFHVGANGALAEIGSVAVPVRWVVKASSPSNQCRSDSQSCDGRRSRFLTGRCPSLVADVRTNVRPVAASVVASNATTKAM